MQTTKQKLRAPHLGRQHNGIALTHGNGKDVSRQAAERPAIAPAPAIVKTYSSKELFGTGSELAIAHRGERYSLRITSLGKLILTK